jgi:small subunit ribosomal protein S16
MLAIRLQRMGSKKRPYFRVVVTEARTPRDSRSLEVLGHYDPRTKPETVRIDGDRFAHWLEAGARPSDSVRTLLARQAPTAGDAGAPSGAEGGHR